jgi:hypothetical protein
MAKEEYSERLFKAEKEFVKNAVLSVSRAWKADEICDCYSLADLAHRVMALLSSGKNTAAAVELCKYYDGWYIDCEPDKNRLFDAAKDLHHENHTAGYAALSALPYFERSSPKDYLLLRARFFCGKMYHLSQYYAPNRRGSESLFTDKERAELLKTIIMIIAYRLYTGGTADEKGGGGGGAVVQAPKKTKVTVGQTALNF